MKIGKKLLWGFVTIVLFLFLSAVVTTVYTLRINNQLETVTEQINPLESNVQDMVSVLWKSNYIVQRYSTENDLEILEELRFEFEHINQQFIQKAKNIAETTGSGVVKNHVGQAANKHRTFYQLAEKLLANRDNDVLSGVIYDQSSLLVQYSIAKQLERDVVGAVEALQEALDELVDIKQEAKLQSTRVVTTAIIMIVLTAIAGIAAAFIVWSSLTKSITKPIHALSQAAGRLSKGQFDTAVEVEDSDNEIADLAFTFNQMVASLRKIVQESPRLRRFIKIKEKKDMLSHGFVLESGTSYVIRDTSAAESYELFLEKSEEGYTPLLVTRQNPTLVGQRYGLPKKSMVWLSDEKSKGVTSVSQIKQLQKVMVDFVVAHPKSIILFDRSDYIVNKNGFDPFLECVTAVNDKIMTKDALLLVPVDPALFSNKQLSLLEKELQKPLHQDADISLAEDLVSMVKFVSNRSALNKPVTYKEIGAEFGITAPTTQKKLEELQQLGLVSVSKVGRNKFVKITRQGQRLAANQ